MHQTWDVWIDKSAWKKPLSDGSEGSAAVTDEGDEWG